MKTLFFSALMLFALHAQADTIGATDLDLVGMWQQVMIDRDSKFHFIPNYKQFTSDGRFVTYYGAKPDNTPTVLSNVGTYAVVNDTTIREHIIRSVSNPIGEGADNDLTFKFRTINGYHYLYVTYTLLGMPHPGEELWVKLEMPK